MPVITKQNINKPFCPSELLIAGFNGFELEPKMKSLLQKNDLGGLILFKRNIDSLEQLVKLNENILNSFKNSPGIISVDQEGGRVARLSGLTTKIPCMKQIAQTKNPLDAAFAVGNILGSELRALGFNLDFAPVCDVFSDLENEVIGDRAFSDDENIVASLAAKIILGLQNNVVAACAKHFPGHGDTKVDSHYSLPFVKTPKEVIFKRELEPFKVAIKSNVATIMTAHIVVEDIDKNLPATLSPTVMSVLRNDLAYDGVIISDDLEMKAVADNYKLEEMLESSLRSDVNMFIISQNIDLTNEAIAILDKFYSTDKELKMLITKSGERVRKLKNEYEFKKQLNLQEAQDIIKSNQSLAQTFF